MVVNRKLTAREETARRNLERLFRDHKLNHGTTHQDINKAIGWSNSVFGQYTTGRIPLNANACIKIAEVLNCYASDIDPELDKEIISKKGVVDVIQEATLLDPAIKFELCRNLAKTLSSADKWFLLEELTQLCKKAHIETLLTQSKN